MLDYSPENVLVIYRTLAVPEIRESSSMVLDYNPANVLLIYRTLAVSEIRTVTQPKDP